MFIPIFWFFTSLRLASASGIFENRVNGFERAFFVSGVTLVTVFFLLPFNIIDVLATWPVPILLLNGDFKDAPILIKGNNA